MKIKYLLVLGMLFTHVHCANKTELPLVQIPIAENVGSDNAALKDEPARNHAPSAAATEPYLAAGELMYYEYAFTSLETEEGLDSTLSLNEDLRDLSDNYLQTTVFSFSQISGLANKKQQQFINQLLRPDVKQYKADRRLLLTSFADSSKNSKNLNYLDSTVDKAKIKQHYKLKEEPEQFTEDHYLTTLQYFDGRYVTISTYSAFDGNIAAHPNSNSSSTVYNVEAQETVTLAHLLKGNYLPTLKAYLQKYEMEEPDSSFCAGSMKQQWIDAIGENTHVSGLTTKGLFLSIDTRDYGCAEVARGSVEVFIPFVELIGFRK